MTAIRAHHYRVDPADLDELISRRARLIDVVRAKHPGFVSARLARLEDGSYSDIWCWESGAQLGAALADIPNIPEAFPAMSLTKDNVVQNGEVIEEL